MTTCALCGFRDATDTTDWEREDGTTREVPACNTCLSPPDVPPEWMYEPTSETQRACVGYGKPTRAAIAAFIADAGEATSADVIRHFGVEVRGEGYSTITMFLSRMRRDGELVARRDGGRGGHQGSFVYSIGAVDIRRHLPQRPRGEVVALARRGKSPREIATALGMNTPAVHAALRTARRLGELVDTSAEKCRVFACSVCGERGHNSRTCEARRAA